MFVDLGVRDADEEKKVEEFGGKGEAVFIHDFYYPL
jgi:hypothetical protein